MVGRALSDQQEKRFFEKYKEYAKAKYGKLSREEFLQHYQEYRKEHREELIELRKKLQEKYGLDKLMVVDETKFIANQIRKHKWFYFGKKPFDCPTFELSKGYYLEHNQLPKPCDECYKALIFWNGLAENNMNNFSKMIKSFDFKYRGKFNYGVVVFYFRYKNEMLEFVELLKKKVVEFNIKGFVQWRRACEEYQKLKPELWKNAKEFSL